MEKAKWARKENDICYWFECSNCGGWPPKSYWGYEWFSHYCPSCGKPMDEPEPEEDDYYMEG